MYSWLVIAIVAITAHCMRNVHNRFIDSPNVISKMDFITALGFLAGTITTIAFFPQVIKTWKSKSTKDISIRMFIVLCTGLFLWIIYGIYVNSLPVVASNGVTFVCATIILALKAKYK